MNTQMEKEYFSHLLDGIKTRLNYYKNCMKNLGLIPSQNLSGGAV